MNVQVVGCSHHATSIAIRERLAFGRQQVEEALREWRTCFRDVESVLLSTCNRVEIYAASQSAPIPDVKEIGGFLARYHRLDPDEIVPHLFVDADEAAVRHLFGVAASLDSMVLGEPQILAQVKQAYQSATECEATGPLLHMAFQAAIRVARRVTTETAIHQRRVSIPSVAVADFARQIFERFDDKETLVIGAGDMAEETLRYLRDEGVRRITVVNRSFERAIQRAREWQGQARPWEELSSGAGRGRPGHQHDGRRAVPSWPSRISAPFVPHGGNGRCSCSIWPCRVISTRLSAISRTFTSTRSTTCKRPARTIACSATRNFPPPSGSSIRKRAASWPSYTTARPAR